MPRRADYFLRPTTLLLACLADGLPRHAYGLSELMVSVTGTAMPVTTVTDTLGQLARDGLVEEVPTRGRRKPYRITDAGRDDLDYALALMHRLARDGRAAMKEWRLAAGRTGDVTDRRRLSTPEVPRDLDAAVREQANALGISQADLIRDTLAKEVQGRGTCPSCSTRHSLTKKSRRLVAHNNPDTKTRCAGAGAVPASQNPA